MARHDRLITLTFRHAATSLHDFQLAAMVAIGSKPISIGVNQYKSHPKQGCLFNPLRLIHAELAAIVGCSLTMLEGSTLYVARRHFDGTPAMAKPCSKCQVLITSVGIKKVYYTIGGTPENVKFDSYIV